MARPPFAFDHSPFVRPLNRTLYTTKDPRYSPADPSGRENRYNGPGTGSVYFGESLVTCFAEARADGSSATWSFPCSSANVLDLRAAENEGHSLAHLMEPSGSGGYVPTRLVSDYAHQNGLDGIRYPSSKLSGENCVVIYKDNYKPTLAVEAFAPLSESTVEAELRDRVRLAAYLIYREDSRPHGLHLVHWYAALDALMIPSPLRLRM